MNRLPSLYRSRAMRLSAALLIGTALTGLSAAPAVAQQANASAARDFSIRSQPLVDAMREFSRVTGIQVAYTASIGSGVVSPGVSGSFAPAEALSRLLAGTGLTFRFTGPNAVTLDAAPQTTDGAIQLGPVRVEGATSGGRNSASNDPLITEGTGSYTTRAVGIGGKTARDPKDTQQSVSVVTSQRIQDQKLLTVEDALNQATGITISPNFQGAYSFHSRGFEITNVQTDGGAPAFVTQNGDNAYAIGIGLGDLATYDHVEVLRGSDGLFAGAGNPGGSVNLVRKRPLDHFQIVAEVLAGSWDRYRAGIDVTGPLAFDGKLRGRFVAAYDTRDFFYDRAYERRLVLYGIAEADLSESTLLTMGLRYENKESRPFTYGLMRYSDGEDLGLPRSTCFCTDWSYSDLITVEPFAKLEQTFGKDWTLKLNVSQRRQRPDMLISGVLDPVDPYTLSGPSMWPSRFRYPSNQTLVDATLNGQFTLFGRKQEIVLGVSWQNIDAKNGFQELFDYFPPVNVFDFRPEDYQKPTEPTSYWDYKAFGWEQLGGYASIRSHVTDRLQVVAGMRFGKFQYNNAYSYSYTWEGVDYVDAYDTGYKQSGFWTPYAGLSFALTPAISLHATYAEIFQPQGNLVTVEGKQLDPITGASYEIGAKGSWLDGRLTASLAGYYIERNGQAVAQPDQWGWFGSNFACCFLADGKATSQGIDAEITGQILPGWQVSAGYTYNKNKIKGGGAFHPQTPRHLLKLWTMVQLPGALSDLHLGGGVNAQSKNYQSGTFIRCIDDPLPRPGDECVNYSEIPFDYTQAAYVIANLSAEYRINDNLSLSVNANNIFDKTYYQRVDASRWNNYYGEPRNVMVSLRGKW